MQKSLLDEFAVSPLTEAEKRAYCIEQGIVPEQHCCLTMAYAISHPATQPHQGKNRVLDWLRSWNEYRIPVSYDGYSSTRIAFCPWCATPLPESREKQWLETLWGMGYNDPGNDAIPEEFEDDRWWRMKEK